MQRLKVLVLASMAVLALSAIASATASAEKIPAPTLLTEPAGSAVTWTGESGLGKLTTLNGNVIECNKDKSNGSFAANAKLGPFTIDFEECKEPGTGFKCTGLGEATGVILVTGEAHLAVDTETPALGAGILFLLNTVHFSCFVLIEVTGKVLCLIKPVNTFVTHFEIVCEETAAGSGDPKETKYWDDNGELAETGHALLTSINHAAGVGSAENTTALILTNVLVSIMV